MRVMALDHGSARTGVAVSDATGTLATPLTVVERVDGDAGFARLLELIAGQAPDAIVVGLPVSLDGREHGQAARARAFARRLAAASDVPVSTYDERFTTKVATQRGGRAPVDARGAAVILEDYLRSQASSQAARVARDDAASCDDIVSRDDAASREDASATEEAGTTDV